MAQLKIPVRSGLKAFTLEVELDGDVYGLSFRWIVRASHWLMDLLKADTVILSGIKVVSSTNFLSQFSYKQVDASIPPGTFQVFDVTGKDRDPDTENFGSGVLFLYTEV